jgi:hypothetical protein
MKASATEELDKGCYARSEKLKNCYENACAHRWHLLSATNLKAHFPRQSATLKHACMPWQPDKIIARKTYLMIYTET